MTGGMGGTGTREELKGRSAKTGRVKKKEA